MCDLVPLTLLFQVTRSQLARLQHEFAVQLVREHIEGRGEWLLRYSSAVLSSNAVSAKPAELASATSGGGHSRRTSNEALAASIVKRSTQSSSNSPNRSGADSASSGSSGTGIEAAVKELLLDDELMTSLQQVRFQLGHICYLTRQRRSNSGQVLDC